MHSIRAIFGFLCLAATGGAWGAETLHYRVSPAADLERLDVQVCGESEGQMEFRAGNAAAPRFLSIESGPARALGDRIRFRGDGDGCFSYAVNLRAALAEGNRRLAVSRGETIVMTSGLWLWRRTWPRPAAESRVEFLLPPGMNVSVPWQPLAGERQGSTYLIDRSPRSWPDRMALGRLEASRIQVPGSELRIAVLPSDATVTLADVVPWISEAAGAVATLYGRFPLPSPQVLVIPAGPAGEPVPWAQVLRGGGTSAQFFVDASRSPEEFRQDWTATHELSHMLLPYILRRDAWVSEGFASYFQNVLRARAGMLPERDAWLKLYNGFQRGRRGTAGLPLDEASRDMGQKGLYMRVYWSGAAIALLADVELRETSGGRLSLDTALSALADCCLPSERAWSGQELFQRLDELTGTAVFTRLYRQHARSRSFPDLTEVSDRLGIDHGTRGLRFSRQRRSADLRTAIMSGPDTGSERLGSALETR